MHCSIFRVWAIWHFITFFIFFIIVQKHSIQLTFVHLYSTFHETNHCKAALQKIQVSTLYFCSSLSVVDVHMTEMYSKGERERGEVVCGQVWWPILGICPLHLTHPSAHSQQWTHTRSSGQPCCSARGAVGGSVPCSRVSPQSWYWRWKEHLLFTPPPTIPAGPGNRTCNLWVTSPTL